MDEDTFAQRVNTLYRELYHRGARRMADARQRPSSETLGLLLHLAQAGPLTLSELSQHLGRAMSTLSAKVAALEQQGLLARQGDPDDARRALVWLSEAGRAELDQAMQVLEAGRLRAAAQRLAPAERERIVAALATLHAAFSPRPEEPDDD